VNPRHDPAVRLAAEVARAARRPNSARTLLLDLDGTLAPIAITPREARVPLGTLEALDKLSRLGWSLSVVSGRPAVEVRSMVPVRGVRIFGSHGAERPCTEDEDAAGESRMPPSAPLARLTAAAASLASGMRGALVEIKPAGIAFHDRAVALANRPAWRQRVRELLAASDLEGLEVLEGRRVVEVRRRGVNKGSVVSAILAGGARPAHDASLVALGDDRTDEDLFRALEGRGLTVRVGRPHRDTRAVRRLPSPKAVRRFLEELVHASEAATSSHGRGDPA